MQRFDTRTFQGLILTLQDYWARQDYTIVQSLDMEIGAGTSHPTTCLRALGSKPMTVVYVQPSRHPTDDRYGENPSRLQHYYQSQVVIKPSPDNIQELYLGFLKELGVDPTVHNVRLVEDNWESPILGVWGLGREVWLNGMKMAQLTYFQQADGLGCKSVTGKITYGLGCLAMYIQGTDSVYDLVWSDDPLSKTTYGDVFHQNEVEQSTYNFEYVDVDFLPTCFEQYKKKAQQLLALENLLPLPAYGRILKAARSFNLLDVRRAISVTERQCYILHTHALIEAMAKVYYASREALGFPICSRDR